MAKVLQRLVRRGLLASQQGTRGGYQLAHVPARISVADVIKARNRPFIFATGYGSSGLPEEYRDRPALQKPFQIETLSKAIDAALKGAAI